jgi:hypothetical protein
VRGKKKIMSDENLLQIVSTPVSTVQDVVGVMTRLDTELADDDGLKWFNKLYLIVTQAVGERTKDHVWNDPVWLNRLDVVFAGLYFSAIRDVVIAPASVHKPWDVLFDARRNPHIMRVQFAICGMNAHINHDLQFGLIRTGEDLNIPPVTGSPQHQDFEFVNSILESVVEEVKKILIAGELEKIDHKLGRIDDILAIWGVKQAREVAWRGGESLWTRRNSAFSVGARHFSTDSLTGVIGRALLIPTI